MSQTLSQSSWKWIKKRPEFRSKELATAMEITLHQAQMVISHLQKLNAITTSHRGYNGAVYIPVPDAKPHLPGKNPTSARKKCLRQKIWSAVRYLQKFTIADVQAAADCSKASVERYLSDLRKHGYVVTVKGQNVKAPMSSRRGHRNQYLLINNTGHKYPVMGANGMRDQNRNKLVPAIKDKKNAMV